MLKIFETQDGSSSVFSEELGASYHSKYGAVQESRHVFIEAGLFYRSIVKKDLKVLEIGFGTGLNVFLTFLEAQKHNLNIDFTAIENFPLSTELIARLNYPAVLGAKEHSGVFQKIHSTPWGKPKAITSFFNLKKMEMLVEDLSFDPHFDLIYFDAFAPNIQPELWEAPILQKIFNALVHDGIMVTYCAKGALKRALKSTGFSVEALLGPPGKREMIRAIKS